MNTLFLILIMVGAVPGVVAAIPTVPDQVRQQISFIDLDDPAARAAFALDLVVNTPGLRAPAADLRDRLDLTFDFAARATKLARGVLEANRLADVPAFGVQLPGANGTTVLSLEELPPLTALLRDAIDSSFNGLGPYALVAGAKAYAVRSSYRTHDEPEAFVLTVPVTDARGVWPLVLTIRGVQPTVPIAAALDGIAQLWGVDRLAFLTAGRNSTAVHLVDATWSIVDAARAGARDAYLAGERTGVDPRASFQVRTRERGPTPPFAYVSMTRSSWSNAFKGLDDFERARIGAHLREFTAGESRLFVAALKTLAITMEQVWASLIIDAAEVAPLVRFDALADAVDRLGVAPADLVNLMSGRTLGRVLKGARDRGEVRSTEWQLLELLLSQRLARDARREEAWGKHGLAESLRFLARGLPLIPIEPEVRTILNLRRRMALALYDDPAAALDTWMPVLAYDAARGLFTEDHVWDALIDRPWTAPPSVLRAVVGMILSYPLRDDPAAAGRAPRALRHLIASFPAEALTGDAEAPGWDDPTYGRTVRRAWRRARLRHGTWRPLVRRNVNTGRASWITICARALGG